MGQSLLYLKHNSVCPYFLTVTYVYLVRRTLKNLFARSLISKFWQLTLSANYLIFCYSLFTIVVLPFCWKMEDNRSFSGANVSRSTGRVRQRLNQTKDTQSGFVCQLTHTPAPLIFFSVQQACLSSPPFLQHSLQTSYGSYVSSFFLQELEA